MGTAKNEFDKALEIQIMFLYNKILKTAKNKDRLYLGKNFRDLKKVKEFVIQIVDPETDNNFPLKGLAAGLTFNKDKVENGDFNLLINSVFIHFAKIDSLIQKSERFN